MRLLEVLIERKVQSLNRSFTYAYLGSKNVDIGFRVLLPFNNKQIIGYVLGVSETSQSKEEVEKEKGYKINFIDDVLDDKPLLNSELMALADEISKYYLSPLIAVLQAMLPKSLKPSSSSLKGPKIAYEKYLHLIDDNEEGLTDKQIELVRLLKDNGDILKRDYKSISIINKLIDLKRITIKKVERNRLVIADTPPETIKKLTPDQIKAVNDILSSEKMVTLLQGVTGSGKTEVYLSLSQHYLKEGRNVLMLVPEIALTPVMVAYFKRRFKSDVAILHSELTDAEKYDEYRRIARGDCRIVVGARSAIFAPLENIGLIILDEEHVESYKQDSLPFYHAREVALMRAKHYQSKVVLGSATPSLESKARAVKGVYNYAHLDKRINKRELPETHIVDMSKAVNLSRLSYMFSEELINSLKKVLSRNEQAILLINRRGFSGYITCRNCGHMAVCPNCGIALTYHKKDNMLKCHHCGYVEVASDTCPECGSHFLSYGGFGTERIEQEVKKIFPEAKTIRLDSDVGQVRNNIQKTLTAFANHEADILVGTQMIAKGHDFPNVTLVGVVLADIGLSIPSFRSSERVFELITQAVGRSGRADKVGKAIIQTYNPYHYAIRYASKQDYESFFKQEMAIRKLRLCPPYRYLISVELSCKDEEEVCSTSLEIVKEIERNKFEDVSIIGPVTPYIAFEREHHVRVILIKYKNSDKIKQYLEELLVRMKSNYQIDIRINVDPYNY